ncbi:MAG: hypothetical protein KBD00_03080 [Candidatus Peribacteraceae bacterium]|nr:hypothetical protein [Candidatus Peribacteraceae bacterium]
MPDCDIIIIGSGPAAVHSAYPLVEAGKTVWMIDGGNTPPESMASAPIENFEDVRRTHSDQYRWFVGDDFSGIPLGGLQGGLGGGQISGNRAYAVQDAEKLLPLSLQNAQVIQSLALGGLGAVWGAACAYLEPHELQTMGMDPAAIEKHYDIITKRIGISGPQSRSGVQPPLTPDLHAQLILKKTVSKKDWLTKKQMLVTQPHSAILTEPLGTRQASTENDMEYWSDAGGSVYRPQMSVKELSTHSNFSYKPGYVVTKFREESNEVIVDAIEKDHPSKALSFTAKRLILAAGAVGSARLTLLSRNLYNTEIPFVGKPHVLSACFHPASLGNPGPKKRSSLCQLIIRDEVTRDDFEQSCTQLYSYRSLLLFRLLSSVPLAAPSALRILAALSPALVIADIRFPGFVSDANTLSIQQTDHPLAHTLIRMTVSRDEQSARRTSLRRQHRAMRKIGLLPVKTLLLPEASTSHYGGTIACNGTGELRTDSNGKLNDTNNVYVADSSVFRALPAKPHTLTLMANANRIGTEVLATC